MAASSETPVSPITATQPALTIATAAINDVPIELDSTPISPKDSKESRRGSTAAALDAFHANKNMSPAERERRAKLITERKADPAVLVDVPQGPAADELERSGASQQDDDKPSKTSTKT